LKLVQNVIHSILVVKNSLKLADVLTVSTKNTVSNLISHNNNCKKYRQAAIYLPVFYLNKIQIIA